MKKFIFFPLVFLFQDIFCQIDSIRSKIIKGLSEEILKLYYYHDQGMVMVDSIQTKYKSGGYDKDLNRDEFLYELTKDLQRISGQKHLQVYYDGYTEETYKPRKMTRMGRRIRLINARLKLRDDIRRLNRLMKKDNNTYGEIKILPGNIGYIEVLGFEGCYPMSSRRIKLRSVMRFLRNTQSLIIDLRENGGGRVYQAGYFVSFFLKSKQEYSITTIDKYRFGKDSLRHHKFGYPQDQRRRYTKPLYVLTSSYTFSSGEIAAYLLRKHAKAKLIGTNTSGSGLGIYSENMNELYHACIPASLIIDEEANNTEMGKAIHPDVEALYDSSFQIAYRRAILEVGNNAEIRKERIFKEAEEYDTGFVPTNPTQYLGEYGRVQVFMGTNGLYMRYSHGTKQLMHPVTTDIFRTEGFKSVRFIRIESVPAVVLTDGNGIVHTFRKK